MALCASFATLVLGLVLAARRFPGGFDWAYTVMSALASRRNNPGGSVYFAAGLSLSLAFLWPAVTWIRVRDDARCGLVLFGLRALRAGIFFGVLVGVERMGDFHLFQKVRKGHEILAALCFLSLYAGVLALYIDRVRGQTTSFWPGCIAITPLVAVGVSQLGLYLDQRDLGWVNRDWREMGVPVWLSFAFWQWLAALVLWVSIGHLVASGRRARAARAS